PLLTTTVTDESRGASDPAAGSVRITLPVSTVALNSSPRTAVNRLPASVADAASKVASTTSGTRTGAGPSLTTSVTCESFGCALPIGGSVPMTPSSGT